MTISLPRWPVQRQILQQPGLRELPIFVCRQNVRGVLSVVSWAWVMPPTNRKRSQPVIQPGFSLSEALAVLASVYGEWASRVARVIPEDSSGDVIELFYIRRPRPTTITLGDFFEKVDNMMFGYGRRPIIQGSRIVGYRLINPEMVQDPVVFVPLSETDLDALRKALGIQKEVACDRFLDVG